jgi:hypothetical protein
MKKYTSTLIYLAILGIEISTGLYLNSKKEFVSKTYISRHEINGNKAHIIKQEDCFHPFKNIKFKAPSHFIAQTYDSQGDVKKQKQFLTKSRARKFIKKELENL